MSLSEPEGAPIKGQQGCTPSGVFRAGCVSLPFSGFRGPPASRAHGPSCVFTAHHSCLCPCSHVLLSCLYFTRTRMITLNHAENPQQESPHLTILNFIMSAKSPPLLTKRRDSQGLGLGHGHLWGGIILSTSGDFSLPSSVQRTQGIVGSRSQGDRLWSRFPRPRLRVPFFPSVGTECLPRPRAPFLSFALYT